MDFVYWGILAIILIGIAVFVYNIIVIDIYFKRRDNVIHAIFVHCKDSIYADKEPLIEFDDMYPIPEGLIWPCDCRLDHIVPKEKIQYLGKEVKRFVIK